MPVAEMRQGFRTPFLWKAWKTAVACETSVAWSLVRSKIRTGNMGLAMKDLDGIERALLATVCLSILVLVAAMTATTVS